MLWFVVEYVAAKHKRQHLRRWTTVADAVSIVPIVVLGVSSSSLAVRLIRLLRAIRILNVFHVMKYITNQIEAQLVRIGLAVLSMTFICAAMVQLFESSDILLPEMEQRPVSHFDGLDFATTYYMVIVTITTIGYGDVVPITGLGRLTIMLLIGTAFLTIPRETNKLVALLSQQSTYVRQSYSSTAHGGHIVVTGAVGAVAGAHFGTQLSSAADTVLRATTGILPFFSEFFNDDHGHVERQAVVLGAGYPSPHLMNMLTEAKYSLGITYLDGNIMDLKDLDRAQVKQAAALFILCNKFAKDPDAEDSSTILRALAVKRYVHDLTGRDIKCCVQLIRAENKRLFFQTTQALDSSGDAVASFEANMSQRQDKNRSVYDLLHGMGEGISGSMSELQLREPPRANPAGPMPSLHQSRSFHSGSSVRERIAHVLPMGVSAMSVLQHKPRLPPKKPLTNLAVCVEEIKLNLLAKSCLAPGLATMMYNLVVSDDDEAMTESGQSKWQEQYGQGCEYEIYRVPLSTGFEGDTFADAAHTSYRAAGVLLFALEINVAEMAEPRIVLNPADMIIPSVVEFDLHGYVIATNKREADVVSIIGLKRARRLKLRAMSSREVLTSMPGDRTPLSMAAHHADDDIVGVSTGSVLSSSDDELLPSTPPATALGSEKQVTGFQTISATTFAGHTRLRQHVLLCSLGIGEFCDLRSFIDPLRADHLPVHLPIVVLQPSPPSARSEEKLKGIRGLFHLQGSPLEARDLQRAGVMDAAAVVILANAATVADEFTRAGDATLLDADTICVYRSVRALNPGVEVIAEIVNERNAIFMGAAEGATKAASTAAFAAGHVFTPAFLDMLLAQAYYNPHVVGVLDALVSGSNALQMRVWNSRMQDRIGEVRDSHLHLCPVPDEFYGRTYGELFKAMLRKQGILLLGLRRLGRSETGAGRQRALGWMKRSMSEHLDSITEPVPTSHDNVESSSRRRRISMTQSKRNLAKPLRKPLIKDQLNLGNTMPYVYTNPRGTEVLYPGDAVYLLSRDTPAQLQVLVAEQHPSLHRSSQDDGMNMYGPGPAPVDPSFARFQQTARSGPDSDRSRRASLTSLSARFRESDELIIESEESSPRHGEIVDMFQQRLQDTLDSLAATQQATLERVQQLSDEVAQLKAAQRSADT